MALDPAVAVEIEALGELKIIRDVEESGDSDIQTMFKGAVVFITGGTGFVGKQLLEKLFRSCRGIEKVYLLTRSKKGKTMAERLNEQFKDPVYNELKKVYPNFHERIIPIQGSVSSLKLGIDDETWNKIKGEINFIIYAAATVRFDEPLKTAVEVNVRGVREMLRLARDCTKLRSMVYVSTAFAHCNRTEVSEQFYQSPVPPESMIDIIENIDESKIDAITPKIIEGWPNTYTFSKAIAEDLVREMGQGLPICVIRPSIVTPTFREPVPGWLDISNAYGPSSSIVGIGLGVIRTVLGERNAAYNLVPLDFVNNLVIAAAYETAQKHDRGETDIKIYTISSKRNPVKFREIEDFLNVQARELATPKAVWYCFSFITSNKYLFLLQSIFLHFIPALFVDAILALMDYKIRLTKFYIKAYKINTVLSFFVSKEWSFDDENTFALQNKLTEKDRQIFHFDVAKIELVKFMNAWCVGIRRYILKDGLKGTRYAMKKQFWLKIANIFVAIAYFLFLWKTFAWFYGTLSIFISIFFM